tara:strand:+ start:164 stop:919 length:756 start_codon:yes stop_codon:yes gene_type:complete
MKNLLAIIIVLLSSSVCYSQVNIESKRIDNKKTITFMSELGIKLDKGNVKTLEVDFNKRLDINISKNNKLLLLARYSYGEADTVKFKEESYAHARLTSMLFFKKRFGFEEFLQIQQNEFYDLNSRKVIGFSTRTHTYMSKNKALNSFLGIGAMKEWEELINDRNNTNIRSTNYFTIMTETKDKHKIISVTYYQPLFTNINDYRIISENIIEFALSKILYLKNSLTYQFDSRPPKNIDENNLSLKVSFILKY